MTVERTLFVKLQLENEAVPMLDEIAADVQAILIDRGYDIIQVDTKGDDGQELVTVNRI